MALYLKSSTDIHGSWSQFALFLMDKSMAFKAIDKISV